MLSSNSERISEFVSCHLNPLIQLLPSYVKNTTHLLNIVINNVIFEKDGSFKMFWKHLCVTSVWKERKGSFRRERNANPNPNLTIPTHPGPRVSLLLKTPFPFLSNACHAGYVLPTNAMLVTLDVSSLYTNIPLNEGIDACRIALSQRTDRPVPTESIYDLIHMILTMNNFVFNNEHFIHAPMVQPWAHEWLQRLLICSWRISKGKCYKITLTNHISSSGILILFKMYSKTAMSKHWRKLTHK